MLALAGCSDSEREVVIGSKKFTESVILGEVLAGLVADARLPVRHRQALGGTRIVYNALVSGEIDAYVEYSGTLIHELLRDAGLERLQDPAERRRRLAERLRRDGILLAGAIGFQNNYALGMTKPRAAELGIERISDLRAHPDLRLRFPNESMERKDGWPALKAAYALPQQDVRGVEHTLAYRALAAGSADVTALYTTDAEIAYYDLATLVDDQGFFPSYDALLLVRADLAQRAPRALKAMRRSIGIIDGERMTALNAAVQLDGASEQEAAADLLAQTQGIAIATDAEGLPARLAKNTAVHALLVGVSLSAAVLIAVPLGIVAAHRRRLGQAVLAVVGIAQTIPALALLVFMIPVFGIGTGSALVALFLYSLLPIVRNTHAGITGIAPALTEAAEALGLPPRAPLWRTELPPALPTILAGTTHAPGITAHPAHLTAQPGPPR
ncbi:glycine betaine ABC transporter substrate-binding protein, partial [Thiohalocapsa sp.]|uniref:ABC transporter permease/substrate-binding protein n=1 Tax=Thiohalocapsa sp. TaxID=2497641 RepID=UPI0025E9CF39